MLFINQYSFIGFRKKKPRKHSRSSSKLSSTSPTAHARHPEASHAVCSTSMQCLQSLKAGCKPHAVANRHGATSRSLVVCKGAQTLTTSSSTQIRDLLKPEYVSLLKEVAAAAERERCSVAAEAANASRREQALLLDSIYQQLDEVLDFLGWWYFSLQSGVELFAGSIVFDCGRQDCRRGC